ncbi:30S ribosomal protein S12 methylthiotransferase RimO [Clostridium sp. CM028]|uniref:30S ribosomal protein S12 methylthiotransferase RimO n=1 Tax=unclassified Clostridium TaxID=2614128 RepID=UPI001C0E3EFB|nr:MULTISPECIES: 30S ribosomal protein S12 methylthiotransferase RimO [unclassified Clostridium]MBU3092244.1 30S ribosomal protein S12 methylthiotransferase RimO [Clostridium sp. CF011]MBW9144061.1 30S ribosomal protein S12 methylthiotransferase RimO [Clostridium sp. CM027]MBW9147628.1 30S ribosomal protein S12 methylthiotransferase RimO [Clostridium sp. CM028]UVE41289.1 30S ribosomal protein S12 methylthiotransferase RimO [Clostridium sp. CM027]WAG70285.1 30S ribosomal protein S12 methylthiot
MEKLKVGVINLGCDKNRIDSEIVISSLSGKYDMTNDPKLADIILVNTCGFIESSKQESIDTILEMSEYKKKYNCTVLIATGCLTQRYGSDLIELMPELDIILGVNDYDKLVSSIEEVLLKNIKVQHCTYSDDNINEGQRVLTTETYSAYIRISEGCDNACAYCAIPNIRGKYRSRKMENIIQEAKDLSEHGCKEIILVAQDTTRYGIDLYGEKNLHKLIRKISQISGIEWIRVLYCYAEEMTDDIINEISLNDKVCKYVDIPIQHISDDLLKSMKRKGRKNIITENINKMRKGIKGLTLRTTLIVGFPGETEENFEELKQFINETKFDKLGVFKYSMEDGTAAAEMKNQIPEEIKEKREEELMIVQQNISKEINSKKIDKIYKVLVEGFNGKTYFGRSYEMAPEVDGTIFFESDKDYNKGEFVTVRVTKALEYDLIGVVCYESCK